MPNKKISELTAATSINGGDTIEISQSGTSKKATATTLKTYFGLDAFTALSGTTWDGSNKTVTLTANTALTFSSTKRNGILKVKQDGTGSRTLSINSISVPISSAANSITTICYFYDDVAGTYIFSYDTNILGNVGGVGGGDTTAPTVSGIVASDAHTITVTLSEATTGFNGFTLKKGGVAMSITAHSFPTSSSIQFTVSDTMTSTDTLTADYSPGDVADTSSNPLASFTAHSVTNSIPGGVSWVDVVLSGQATEVSAKKWWGTTGGDAYLSQAIGNKSMAASADGALRAKRTADTNGCIFGFKETNAAGPYSEIKAGFTIVSDGSIYKVNNGALALVANPGVVNVNDYVKIVRTGSAWKLQYSSDGSTWNDFAGGLGSLTYAGTVQVYAAADLDNTSSSHGYLFEPMGYNVS